MTRKKENDQNVWEATCAKCGRCCYEKIDFEGRIYYTDLPCEFLEITTNMCRVYAEREVKRPGCVRLTQENVKKGFLPADCPYVADIENYPAPNLSNDPDPE